MGVLSALWLLALALYAAWRLWMQGRYMIDMVSPGAGLLLALLLCLGFLSVDPPGIVDSKRLLGFVLALALLACGEQWLWLRVSNKEQYLIPGLALLLGGSGLLLACLEKTEDRPAAPKRPLALRWELASFAGILLFAAALRLWRLGAIPETWWFDEVNLARGIQEHVLKGEAPIYIGEQIENPGAYLMVGAAIFKFFGGGVTALRCLSAFYGWLALIPFYFLARRCFGSSWALAALLLYASMRWTLIPQRIAFMSGFALFWTLCAVYFYWRALATRALLDLALAGFSLGATLHTYTPARATGFFLLIFSLCHLRYFRGLSMKEALAFALPAALLAAPILGYAALHWDIYSYRSSQVSILNDIRAKGWGELWASFSRHLLMFNFRGDHQARHNISYWPQLDYLSALAFVPAFFLALRRSFSDSRAALLLIWFCIMLAQGILSISSEAPQGHRTILAAPAVALLIIWLCTQISGLEQAFARGWPRPLLAASLCLALAVPLFNATELMGSWAHDAATWRSFSPEANLTARRAAASPEGSAIFVSPLDGEYPFNGYERMAFTHFALAQQGRNCLPLRQSLNAVMPCAQVLALWGESERGITAQIKSAYPSLSIEDFRDPYDQKADYLAVVIPYALLPKGASGSPLFFRP